ncbi:MAG: hypothetical protein NVS9B15_05060 [Acidobacteriaceae bacterium]
MSDRHAQHIYLTGFMGCGKTTVGALAATQLGIPFVDIDHEIEARSSRTITNIFAEDGEPSFRALEQRILSAVLEACIAPTLIALGGGTWMQPDVHALIPPHRVVLLDVPFEVIRRRVKMSSRPLATTLEAMRDLYNLRATQYRTAGHVLLHEAHERADGTAMRLAKLIRNHQLLPPKTLRG